MVSSQAESRRHVIGERVIPFSSGDLGLYLGVIIGTIMLLLLREVLSSSSMQERKKWLLVPSIFYFSHHFIIWNWWERKEFLLISHVIFTRNDLDFILGFLAGIGMIIFAMMALQLRLNGEKNVFRRHVKMMALLLIVTAMSITNTLTDGKEAGIVTFLGLSAVLGILILLYDATLLTLEVVLDVLQVSSKKKDTARAFTGLALLIIGSLIFVLKKSLEFFSSETVVPWQASLQVALFQWGSLLVLSSFITLTVTKIKSKAFLEIGRPYMVFMGIFPILLGMTMTVGSMTELMHEIASNTTRFLALMIGALMSVMFTNTYNAVHDYQEDAVSKPHRPIPSGLMTPREALYLSLVPAVITLTVAFLFLGPIFQVLAPAFLLVGWLYSKLHVKGRYLLPYLWMGTGYVIGGMLVGWLYFFESSPWIPSIRFWILTLILGTVAFFGMIMKDLGDMIGDAKVGYRTLPLMLGERAANNLVVLSLYLPLALGLTYMLAFESLTRILAWVGISLVMLGPIAVSLMMRLRQAMNHPKLDHRTNKYQSLFIPVLLYHFLIHLTLLIVLGVLS